MASTIARYYLKHFVLSRQCPSVRNETCFSFLAMERFKKNEPIEASSRMVAPVFVLRTMKIAQFRLACRLSIRASEAICARCAYDLTIYPPNIAELGLSLPLCLGLSRVCRPLKLKALQSLIHVLSSDTLFVGLQEGMSLCLQYSNGSSRKEELLIRLFRWSVVIH